MTTEPVFDGVIACVRAAARHSLPGAIQLDHSFVTDLGFDSMGIARLALALEDEFDQTILLDEWIGQATDPSALTVESLCDYVAAAREDNEQAAV